MDARGGHCQHLDLKHLWKLIKQEQKISTQNKHHCYLNFVFKMCHNDCFKHWADLKLALFSRTKSAIKCDDRFLLLTLLISEWTDTYRLTTGGIQLWRALLARGNGNSSLFPGTRGSTSMVFTTDVKQETTWSNRSLFYTCRSPQHLLASRM